MLEFLVPREKIFFDLFNTAAAKSVQACEAFAEMLKDLGHAESHARRVKTLEHEADEVTHQTVDLLHRTFVTPLDRDAIYHLISRLDDVLDLVEAAAERLQLYEVKEATPEAHEFARVLVDATKQIRKAIECLGDTKKNRQHILDVCIEVHRLENEADMIQRNAVAKLFREEQEIRMVLKWKEIYDYLETATDRCEDVANIVEGIVIEQA